MDKKAIFTEKLVYWILTLNVLLSLATTVAVIFIIGSESYSFFCQIPLKEFFTGGRWEPLLEPRSFGIWPLVCGTGLVVLGSIVIALPMGIAVAVFLSEFVSTKIRRWIKPAIEILAGIPTVVFGYFALIFITPSLRFIFPQIEVFNALSAMIVVAIMILPMIASMVDDALRDIPKILRQGAFALGATSYETVWGILLPAIRARIGAIAILAISRAIGETMAVTLAAGATPKMTLNPLESIQTLTAFIVQVSMGDVPAAGIEYLSAFAVGSVLFVITFVLNIIGYKFIQKFRMELVG